MDLDNTVDDVDDPVVRDSRAGIQTRLVFAVGSVGALGDLDDQHGVGGMRGRVGAPDRAAPR